ncbi:MAG: hypothetical protein ABSE99_16945 [Terracidiphilus sp.]|jgi:hypothetical protein
MEFSAIDFETANTDMSKLPVPAHTTRNQLIMKWHLKSALFVTAIAIPMAISAQQPLYSVKPFKVPDSYDEKLPIRYPGNSLKAVFDADSSKILSFKSQGEYETQEKYRERLAAFAQRPILGQLHEGSTMAFVLPKVTTRYEIDSQMLFIKIGCTASAYKDSDLDIDNVALTLFSSVISTKKIGKTRMGIQFHYTEDTGSDYSILLPKSDKVDPDKNIVIGIKMAPEESKQARTDIRVLLAGKFNKISMGSETHTASLDEPYEDTSSVRLEVE